uniref:Uncharacterized protein n=1 Tax=Anguilla anguilla TaxID=7936 RepID=A0A0E9X2H0_ANGAN
MGLLVRGSWVHQSGGQERGEWKGLDYYVHSERVPGVLQKRAPFSWYFGQEDLMRSVLYFCVSVN